MPIVSQLFHGLLTGNLLLSLPIKQLFSRAAAQQLYSNQRLQRWCFDVELVHLAQRLKVRRLMGKCHEGLACYKYTCQPHNVLALPSPCQPPCPAS